MGMVNTTNLFLTFLRTFRAGAAASELSDSDVAAYHELFAHWTPDMVMTLMAALRERKEWRPSYAEVLEIAAETFAPVPNQAMVEREILDEITRVGIYGRRSVNHPLAFTAGAPDFSHPLITRIISLMGWVEVCSWDDRRTSLKKAIGETYQIVVAEWKTRVRRELQRPVCERHKTFFAAGTNVRCIGENRGGTMISPSVQTEEGVVPMPSSTVERVMHLIAAWDIDDKETANVA